MMLDAVQICETFGLLLHHVHDRESFRSQPSSGASLAIHRPLWLQWLLVLLFVLACGLLEGHPLEGSIKHSVNVHVLLFNVS